MCAAFTGGQEFLRALGQWEAWVVAWKCSKLRREQVEAAGGRRAGEVELESYRAQHPLWAN